MAANTLFQTEVVVPAGCKVKIEGEDAGATGATGGKIFLQCESQTSLAAAKAIGTALATAITAACV